MNRRSRVALGLWSGAAVAAISTIIVAGSEGCRNDPGSVTVAVWYVAWLGAGALTFAAAIASWWPGHRVLAVIGGVLLGSAVIVGVPLITLISWVDRCAQ
jgi:hypothetical protein